MSERRDDPGHIAGVWYARMLARADSAMPHEAGLPSHPVESLAAFAALVLADGRELMILVRDDEVLPRLSNALDMAIRPLCLVLPQADFAAGTALRATLSLLRSRLWRDGEDTRSAAWTAQQQRLDMHATLWQAALDWMAAPSANAAAPAAVTALFPALILPVAACNALPPRPAAMVVLYACDAPSGLEIDAARLLCLGTASAAMQGTDLAPGDETTRLLLERTRLTQDIGDLELELASVQGELAEFMRSYYQRVGRLLAEHDALRARVALSEAARAPDDPGLRGEAARRKAQARESAAEAHRFADALPPGIPEFKPEAAAKQAFRRLAQQIHPDRAIDDDDRAWRNQLMSEANRAYRHGDMAGLEEIAALWAEQPASRRGAGNPGTSLLRLQLQRLRARLARIESELHRLFGSQLYELFIAARQAGRQNRDLLGEMASRLESEIAELQRASA